MTHALGLAAKWSALGAVFAGGALVVAYYAGPRVVGQLGRAGGEGFAEGTERVRSALANASPPVLGRWG
jgi:hypothetical protein